MAASLQFLCYKFLLDVIHLSYIVKIYHEFVSVHFLMKLKLIYVGQEKTKSDK